MSVFLAGNRRCAPESKILTVFEFKDLSDQLIAQCGRWHCSEHRLGLPRLMDRTVPPSLRVRFCPARLDRSLDRRRGVDEKVGSIEVVLPGNPDQGEQRIAPSVSKSRPHPVRGGGFAGRSKSSRNVYRHGLSCPLPLDPAMSAKVDAIGQALIGEAASEEQLKSAAEFAQAQLELLRIRAIRAEMMKDADLKLGDTQDLRRLAALDRYERLAQTRRRRASHKL